MADSKEPGEEQDNSYRAILWRMWGRLVVIMEGVWIVFRTPSFILILLGNIVGTIVGLSMGYKVLYFQVQQNLLHQSTQFITCQLVSTPQTAS